MSFFPFYYFIVVIFFFFVTNTIFVCWKFIKGGFFQLVKQFTIIIVSLLVVAGLLFPAQAFAQKPDSRVQLRLLETTDIHTFLANYDYYQTKQDDKVGLVKTATLIKQARNEVKNS